MEIENPASNFSKSEEIFGGSSEIEVVQCSKTLVESTLEENREALERSNQEGGEVSEDTQFTETLDDTVNFFLEDDAQFSKTLGVTVNERDEDIGETQITNIPSDLPLVETEDSNVLESLENILDFSDNGEDENPLDKEETRVYPLSEIRFSTPSDCRHCIDEEESCKGNLVTGSSSLRWFPCSEPPRCRNGGFSGGRHMGFMRRSHPYRKLCRRDHFTGTERERETESDGFPSWPDNGERYPTYSYSCIESEPCLVGAGLANLGNTCFLNAIVQCFTHTVAFVQEVLSLKHEASSHGADEFCVLCSMRDQIEYSLAYSGRVIEPSNLVDNLSNISSFFRRYQQEDAHEFLQCLLDKLDNNWSKYEPSGNDALAPDDSSSLDDTLVKKIFGGRLVSQVRCCKCGHNSDTYEPLIDLSLEIEDVDSLESALKSFTKVESIEDTEKFTCDSCKEQVQVEKQLMLDQAPSVAAFHLKRFKSDGVYVEKIDKTVEYPLELDLAPYTKGSNIGNEESKYELFAVVVHVGFSSTSGHYFCYIRTSPDKWYRFDDSKVTRVAEFSALCQDAYILFYTRKGTPWFDSLIGKWKAESCQKISSTSPKSVLDDLDLLSTSYPVSTALHGCEAGERLAIWDTSASASELRQKKAETEAGVGTDLHSSEAVGKTDATGGNIALASDLIQDEVETKACVDAGGSALTNQISTSSSSLVSNDEVKEDKFDLDTLFLMEEIDASKDITWSKKIGENEQSRGGASTSSHEEKGVDGELKNDDAGIKPSTPLRAQSPDVYSDEEPAEDACNILHLKVENKLTSAKKSISTGKQDMRRKEATKYLCKSMPNARARCFIAAMNGSHSDGLLNKKRRKTATHFHGKTPPKKRVKISPKRVLRSVAA